MEPKFTFAKHHRFVSDNIKKEIIEKENGRLLLAIGPGNGKSTLCSQLLPAYILGIDPTAKILLLTYGATLSNDFGKKVRLYMNKPQYKQIFPETIIVGDGESGSFDVEKGGSLKCVGRGGAITGYRANYIIVDDSLKNQEEAKSETILNKLWEWWSTTVYTRLLPGGSIIGFNTRWGKRDLIGRLIDNFPNWTYINLPSIAEENDPLGREVGEAIWPEWEPLSKLLEIKRAFPKTFSALYQGNPVSEEATPIKRVSINGAMVPTYIKNNRIVISWDTANTQNGGDYTVGCVWSLDGTNSATLIDLVRKQVNFTNLLSLFDNYNKTYKPVINIVEKAASGQQLIQLRPDVCLPSTCIKTNDKETTAESFDYSMKQGLIRFLEGVLSEEVITEMAGYPYESHDDVILSMFHFYKAFLEGTIPMSVAPMVPIKQILKLSTLTLNINDREPYGGKSFVVK